MNAPRPSTLWLKTLRDLWLFKGRTLMVVLAIAVGTAAAGVCVTSLIVLRRDLRDGYQRTNPAHAILSTTPFDPALADRVARLPEVTDATARRQTQAQLLIGEESRTLVLATIPDFATADIGRLIPQSGANIPPGVETMLLERSAVTVLSLGVGDPVTLRMPDGDAFPLSLAGAVHDMAVAPTTVQPVVFGYIGDQTAARLGLPETYNQLLVTVRGDPDREAVESAVTTVTEWLADEGVVVQRADIPEPGVHEMQGSVDTGLLMIGILGGLTLLLSAFLVTNVMAAVVAQQTPQIGVMKALGGSRRLVLRQYGRMVVIFGLLALILAVPLGYMGAYFQSSYLAGQLNFDIPSFGLTASTLAVQLIGAVGIPLLAAMGSLRAAGALSIRDALSSRGGTSSAGEQSARLEGLSRPVVMTLRNILRRKGRLALTLAALALAGAMFMATFGLRLGLYEAVEILVGEFPFDVEVELAEPQPARRLLRETEGLAGLEGAEAWGVADARRIFADGRLGTSVTLYGVPPSARISPFAERAGRWLAAGEGTDIDGPPAVYINYEAERLTGRPEVGDELMLKLNGEQERAARLVGISLRPFVPQAYMSLADFERATGRRDQMGRLVVYLEGDDPQRQAAAAAQLSDRFEAAGIIVGRMDTAADIRDGYLAQFNTLVLLLMALAGLTALVGGLGLGNTMALNTLERSREIGVLRALGARRAWLRRLVLAEGVVVALASVIPAVLLSLPLTLALDRVMGVSLLGSPLRFAFAPWAAVGWTALLIVITLLACWFPAENAARMTVREALGYE